MSERLCLAPPSIPVSQITIAKNPKNWPRLCSPLPKSPKLPSGTPYTLNQTTSVPQHTFKNHLGNTHWPTLNKPQSAFSFKEPSIVDFMHQTPKKRFWISNHRWLCVQLPWVLTQSLTAKLTFSLAKNKMFHKLSWNRPWEPFFDSEKHSQHSFPSHVLQSFKWLLLSYFIGTHANSVMGCLKNWPIRHTS